MGYDWRKELRKQREADEADRQRARMQRERTTETAKNWVRLGSIDAAMALYGIEPNRSSASTTSDEDANLIQSSILAIADAHLRFRGGAQDALSSAYVEAVSVFRKRLAEIAVTSTDAPTELSRLIQDYQWLIDELFPDIRSKIEATIVFLETKIHQNTARVAQESATRESRLEGARWRPVKLPPEFWQRHKDKLDREDAERREAVEQRARVNEGRSEVGLPRL